MSDFPSKLTLEEKLNPSITALLVIDVQIDFCSPEGLLAKRGRDLSLMDPMIDRLEKVIETAKRNNVYTAYTQQIYDRTKLSPLRLEQYDLDGQLVTANIATNGYKFYRLNPPKDNVFVKYNFNAFSNKKLLKELERRGVKTLVITGVDSQTCVETAIRNGFDLGYKIVVPKDLIATNARRIAQQERTLELVERIYGAVITSQDLLSIWTKTRF
jgi:ureidoacrylate peracid hydrolase